MRAGKTYKKSMSLLPWILITLSSWSESIQLQYILGCSGMRPPTCSQLLPYSNRVWRKSPRSHLLSAPYTKTWKVMTRGGNSSRSGLPRGGYGPPKFRTFTFHGYRDDGYILTWPVSSAACSFLPNVSQWKLPSVKSVRLMWIIGYT